MSLFLSIIFLFVLVIELSLHTILFAQSAPVWVSREQSWKQNKHTSCFLLVSLGPLASISLGMKALSAGKPWGVVRIWVILVSVYEKKVTECSGLNEILSALHWRNKRLITAIQVTLILLTSPLKRSAAFSFW